MILKTETRFLPCKLTDEEWAQRASECATTTNDCETEEARQASVKAELKARMSELESKRKQLAEIVQRREEFRDVEVQHIGDATLRVQIIRTDTGEVLGTRAMTEQERQEALPLEDIVLAERKRELAEKVCTLAEGLGRDPLDVFEQLLAEAGIDRGGVQKSDGRGRANGAAQPLAPQPTAAEAF